MKFLTAVILVIVGLINISPVIGVLSANQLTRLYGITLESPDLVILMRHRALLFGLLGALIITAAFRPALQTVACIAGLVSMLGFIVIAFSVGDYGDSIGNVVLADLIAAGGLIVVLVLRMFSPANGAGRGT